MSTSFWSAAAYYGRPRASRDAGIIQELRRKVGEKTMEVLTMTDRLQMGTWTPEGMVTAKRQVFDNLGDIENMTDLIHRYSTRIALMNSGISPQQATQAAVEAPAPPIRPMPPPPTSPPLRKAVSAPKKSVSVAKASHLARHDDPYDGKWKEEGYGVAPEAIDASLPSREWTESIREMWERAVG